MTDGGTPSAEIRFEAVYFDGASSARTPAKVRFTAGALLVELADRTGRPSRLRFQPGEVNLSSRLGNTTRSLQLPEHAKLETDDNDAVDRLAEAWGGRKVRAHLLESSWRAAIVAVATLAAMSAAFFVWGIPLLAERAAMAMPDELAYDLGQGTMAALDKSMFDASELPEERRSELQGRFRKMADEYPSLPLQLLFRKAGMANAFALPNGKVVVTDELVEIAESDDEILAVLAHEIGHVEHRHTARMALESSAVGLIAMMYLGDATQMASIAGALPAIYANSHYSRAHETQADTFALKYMDRTGLPKEAFASILERMTKESGGDQPELLRYIASHPATDERVARFRD